MTGIAILVPVFALAVWTLVVLLLVPLVRVRSALRRQVVADDFRFGGLRALAREHSKPVHVS